MRRFSFEVPSVPGRALSPNASRKQHWGHRRDAKDEMKTDWGNAIKEARGRLRLWDSPLFLGEVSCTIEVYWPPKRKGMDEDNLRSCFKWGVDQLEVNGIVENDRQLTFPKPTQQEDPEKRGFVRVTLEGE